VLAGAKAAVVAGVASAIPTVTIPLIFIFLSLLNPQRIN